jgi:hypothetical protein
VFCRAIGHANVIIDDKNPQKLWISLWIARQKIPNSLARQAFRRFDEKLGNKLITKKQVLMKYHCKRTVLFGTD